MTVQPILLKRRLEIDVPAEDFWQIISDTGRTNHAIGLPPIEWSEEHRNGRIAVIGTSQFLGMPLRWIEHPFEWVYGEYFQVEREFMNQPLLHSLTTGSAIRPIAEQRCEVTVSTSIIPRGLLGRGLALVIVRKLVQDHARLLRTLEAAWTARSQHVYPVTRQATVDLKMLRDRIERMEQAPIGGAGLERLIDLIETGRDEDVTQMRPFVLADEWQLDRMAVLRMFLYATVAGILELNWDILCPNCRVSRDEFHSLRDLTGTSHCEACRIEYNVNFDDYVELRFNVHPAIRQGSHAMFCSIGGPSYNRHILAQQRIKAGETRTIDVHLEAGDYRFRMLGSEQRCHVDVHEQAEDSSGQITMTEAGITPENLKIAPGKEHLTITNTSDAEQLLIIESATWNVPFVSAALVTTMPEFRTMFSSEVLAPGLGVSIRNLTFLFSDLKNSTPMYEQIGDSPAYALVRDHFDILFAAIASHNGTIVKTIGDAVMAVFATPSAATQAAIEMQAHIHEHNLARAEQNPLILKIGLHNGPAIAVNANDVLDYFGTTVNVAARAQAVSVGGDIILTSDVYHDPHVHTMLGELPFEIDEFTRDLKGLQHAYTLYRLTPIEHPQTTAE